jgi:glycosyltransferase involved in cell wall biosynthesis
MAPNYSKYQGNLPGSVISIVKISVITVSYNSAATIATAVSSVASQVYQNIEHLVIDGQSTDETRKVVEAHCHPYLIFSSESDSGIYDAMNKGLKRATGAVVGFLNSDDFYSHEHVLNAVAECFEKDPCLEACYSDLVYVDQFNVNKTVRFWKSSPFRQGSFSHGWCPPHPTFFVSRAVYERFGFFDANYRIAADAELMIRFLEVHKIRVKYIPDVWVKMRLGGTTNKNLRNIWLQNQEILRALKSHRLASNPIKFLTSKLFSRGLQFVHRPAK